MMECESADEGKGLIAAHASVGVNMRKIDHVVVGAAVEIQNLVAQRSFTAVRNRLEDKEVFPRAAGQQIDTCPAGEMVAICATVEVVIASASEQLIGIALAA